jgi:hypothetical protein
MNYNCPICDNVLIKGRSNSFGYSWVSFACKIDYNHKYIVSLSNDIYIDEVYMISFQDGFELAAYTWYKGNFYTQNKTLFSIEKHENGISSSYKDFYCVDKILTSKEILKILNSYSNIKAFL